MFSLQSLSFALPVLNNVVGLEQKVEDLDQNVEGDQSDLPFFQPPSQIRFTVRGKTFFSFKNDYLLINLFIFSQQLQQTKLSSVSISKQTATKSTKSLNQF